MSTNYFHMALDVLVEHPDDHNHPLEVAAILRRHGFGYGTIQAAALLHDIVEDTDVTLDDLRSADFPDVGVVDVVAALTQDPKFRSRDARLADSLRRCMANGVEAVAVKIADRIHNVRRSAKNGDSPSPKHAAMYLAENEAFGLYLSPFTLPQVQSLWASYCGAIADLRNA